MCRRVVIAIVLSALILGGCKPGLRKPLPICAGKGSVGESILAIESQGEKVGPLKAKGSCLLEYYEEGRRKPHKEPLKVRLWMNPPSEISLHGFVGLDPRGIVLGSNKDEFWLAIKPKISSYWRGQWSDGNNVQNLILSPKIVLEAVGIVTVRTDTQRPGDWSLTNEGPFDILTQRTDQGVTIKKIYVCSCDYLVRKIEYFDEFGLVAVVAELEDYAEVVEGFKVPKYIKVVKQSFDGRNDSVRIKLKTVETTSFSEKLALAAALFQATPGRYKHVYGIVDGEWVEQLE